MPLSQYILASAIIACLHGSSTGFLFALLKDKISMKTALMFIQLGDLSRRKIQISRFRKSQIKYEFKQISSREMGG